MSYKTIINVFLIIAVVSLGVFLVKTRDENNDQSVTLTSIQPGTIDRIGIYNADRKEIKFEKRTDGWFMTAPLAVRANTIRIGAMLQMLQTPSFAQLPEAEHDLQRFELEAPAVSLILNDQEFYFGGTNPLEGRRYVMIGDTVHLITDGLFPQLQQRSEFFISPQLIPEGTLLQSIELPGYVFIFENNKWSGNDDTGILEEDLDTLITAWQSATATRIEILEPAGSMGEVIIHTRTGEVMRFEIQQREPVLKLTRTDLGITYDIPADTASDLFPVDHK